jgi:hypothetical protein
MQINPHNGRDVMRFDARPKFRRAPMGARRIKEVAALGIQSRFCAMKSRESWGRQAASTHADFGAKETIREIRLSTFNQILDYAKPKLR